MGKLENKNIRAYAITIHAFDNDGVPYDMEYTNISNLTAGYRYDMIDDPEVIIQFNTGHIEFKQLEHNNITDDYNRIMQAMD